MSHPATPRRGPLSLARVAGLGAILILVLIGLAQCGSTKKSTTDPAGTSGTTSPTAEPRVAGEPVTLPPAPVSEPEPAPEPVPMPEPAPVPETAPLPDHSDDDSGGGSVYYKNCSAARAAGVAPLHAGEPGYASHLDRDGDGVACE